MEEGLPRLACLASRLLLAVSNLPAQVFSSNVEQRIHDFLADPEQVDLVFDPDLAKEDRALVHVLAQKHNLSHKSTGKGDSRFITVRKRTGSIHDARADEAQVEAQFHQVHAMGYAHHNRGVGLGFDDVGSTVISSSTMRSGSITPQSQPLPSGAATAASVPKRDRHGSAAAPRDGSRGRSTRHATPTSGGPRDRYVYTSPRAAPSSRRPRQTTSGGRKVNKTEDDAEYYGYNGSQYYS